MSDFLQLAGKSILVLGVANRKSVAWHAAQVLREAGADVIYSVRNEARRESVQKLVGDAPVLVCDVEHEEQIDRLKQQVAGIRPKLHGMLHSIAFADYASVKGNSTRAHRHEQDADTSGPMPFHETPKSGVFASCRYLLLFADRLEQFAFAICSIPTRRW